MTDNLVGKDVDIEFRAFHRDVKILRETKTGEGYIICHNYRLKNNPKWMPIESSISKKMIINIKEKKEEGKL